MFGMGQPRPQSQSDPHDRALEACAGLALACAYSSSDEYEAEVIQARRKAGAYGSWQHRQAFAVQMFAIVLIAAAVAAALFAVWRAVD
jgi:uncharacterized membrane protein YbaN (DUF454 family)